MHTRNRPVRLACSSGAALGLALGLASSPVSADPPVLPLQGPGVAGLLSIPYSGQAIAANDFGTYRLTSTVIEATGTSHVELGIFAQPAPFLIGTASSSDHRYTRTNTTVTFEFAVVPPPELGCAFPAFAIPGPECRVDVLAAASGRVQTHGSTILAGDPPPSFVVSATWSLQDDLGTAVFSGGIQTPLTNDGAINAVFSDGQLLSLKANHAYRVTMNINAEAAASTLPAAATALVTPAFSFGPGTAAGHSFRFSGQIGNAVPEPDGVALLGAGVIAIGLRRRRRSSGR